MGNTITNTAETENSVSFDIQQLQPEGQPQGLQTAQEFFEKITESQPQYEDFSHRGSENQAYIPCDTNPILGAVHSSFSRHQRLVLSVSDFIYLIGKGLSQHITQNAEELRSNFVDHSDKKEISISRDSFVLGKQNDWSTVFDEFSQEIKKAVKSDVYGVIIDDTSVATRNSRIVSEIVLMDAMSKYFSYVVHTKCGIPSITLKGTPKDWENLKNKVAKLKEMNKDDCLKLKWWPDELVPIVDKLCEQGMTRKFLQDFWKNFYKYQEESGSQTVTGWICAFIPYTVKGNTLTKNVFEKSFSSYKGIQQGLIPKSLNELPFNWSYLGTVIPMKFYAFPAPKWDKVTNEISVDYLWGVVHAKKEMKD